MSSPINKFSILLKEAVQQSGEKDVEEFFKNNFLSQLDSELENTEVPAEYIRHKRKQTTKIKNFLLTLGRS